MAIKSELDFTVSNKFGMRTGTGDAIASQTAAASVANGVITSVKGYLDTFKDYGQTSLDDAVTAIDALGNFKPSTISVSFSPPKYTTTTPLVPDTSITQIFETITPVSAGTFSASVTDPPSADNSGSAPEKIVIDNYKVPTKPTVNVPIAPTSTSTSPIPEAPNPGIPSSPSFSLLTAPKLDDLKLPVFKEAVIPSFRIPNASDAPELPNIVLQRNIARVKSSTVSVAAPNIHAVKVGGELTEREVRSSTEVFKLRGVSLDAPVAVSQAVQARDYSAMLNATEIRRLGIDYDIQKREYDRASAQFQNELDANKMAYNVALFKQILDFETYRVTSRIELAKSLAALYNAKTQEINSQLELYKASLEAKLAYLDKWKAKMQIEVAKSKVNVQLGQNYTTQVASIASRVDVYNAQVSALQTEVDLYKAKVLAMQAKGDAAKASVGVFTAKLGVYSADLESYKSIFEEYSVKAKAVSAQNQLVSSGVKVSATNLIASTAEYDQKITALEKEAEKIKLDNIVKQAEYDVTRVKNVAESINAQVYTEKAKLKVHNWTGGTQLKSITYDAQGVDNEGAVRFYSSALSSAYRAAEQATKALSSAIESSAMAQEAAARSASSVAQGAYSAIHVSAGLHGAGSATGSEENSDRLQLYFSDMLNASQESVAITTTA